MKLASLSLVTLLAACVLASAPAQAGFDIDFGVSVRAGDDTDLYLAISSRYFDRDRATVNRFAAHYDDPDDLAVVLYLAKRSGRPCDRIHRLRRRGLSWFDISVRLGLPVDIWFVDVRHDPGPPYGKAYGHWKHHKKNKHHHVVLADADIRNLMAVRMLHEYYGVSVGVAMEWRSSGRRIRAILSDEYHKRHAKPAHAGHKHHDKHHSKGKGKGKGHKRH